jgi:hypothetical protein
MDDIEGLLRLGTLLEEEPESVVATAKKYLRVRDRHGKIVPLTANAAQLEFERRRGRQNIVLKARQMGMTTWVAARFFLKTMTHGGTLTLQVAHTQAAAEAIFQTVQRMWEHLPLPVRQGVLRLSRNNAGQMVFAELDSEYRVASASDWNAGRGLSVQNLHCSEVSRWPGDAAATLAGLRAALAPGGEMVLESTPCGAYGAFYREWCESEMVKHFLPWWMEPAYTGTRVEISAMTGAELDLHRKHGLSGEQIGFRRGLERGFGVLRAQEFAEDAETCFRATGQCFFDVEAIEQRLADTTEAIELRRGGALQIWLSPKAGREYVVGVDSAGGGEDGDFAAVQVIDRETGLQCAELQERLRPAQLAHIAAELAREYNQAMVAVERNNHGAAVLAYIETNERYERVYRDRGEAGWLTTSTSKPEMVARIGSMLERTPQRFMSRRLLAECRTFVAEERGKTGAARGSHDDLVMAMAVALAVRSAVVLGS